MNMISKTTTVEPERDRKGPQPPWIIVMKFGEKAHMEDFRSGRLYTRPLFAFATLEKDALRQNRFEGTSRISQPQDISEIRLITSAQFVRRHKPHIH